MSKDLANTEVNSTNLMDFAYTEFMGHGSAYKIREREEKRAEGELIIENIMDRDGVVREYAIYKLEAGHEAIAGEVYIPIDPSNANIHITWKGTDDGAGISADVSQEAPAEHSYRKRETTILKQINDVVGLVKQRSGKNPSINITGHSLGGSVSAMCHNSILRGQAYNLSNELVNAGNKQDLGRIEKLMACNADYSNSMRDISQAYTTQLPSDTRNHLSDIGELFIGTWNTACVNPALQKNSTELLGLLNLQNTRYIQRIGLVGGDAVPTAGSEQYLRGVSSDLLDQQLLKVSADIDEGFYKTFAEASAVAAGGAVIGTAFGPVGTWVGGTVGFVAGGLVIGGTKTLLAHTASHFAIDEKTKNIILTRSKDKVQLHTNATPEGKKAINDDLSYRSNVLHAILQIRKQIKYMFKLKKEKKLTMLPEGKVALDVETTKQKIDSYLGNKFKHKTRLK
jgi:hypothetical protein